MKNFQTDQSLNLVMRLVCNIMESAVIAYEADVLAKFRMQSECAQGGAERPKVVLSRLFPLP